MRSRRKHVESIDSASPEIDPISRHSADNARLAIDMEITMHEAVILDLRSRRNMHSDISRLPPEVFAKIFRFVQLGQPHAYKGDFAWMNVGGVCRHWWDIVPASPRLWVSIGISQPDSPLQITCRRYHSDLKQYKKVAEVVMEQISRIQSLNIATIQMMTFSNS